MRSIVRPSGRWLCSITPKRDANHDVLQEKVWWPYQEGPQSTAVYLQKTCRLFCTAMQDDDAMYGPQYHGPKVGCNMLQRAARCKADMSRPVNSLCRSQAVSSAVPVWDFLSGDSNESFQNSVAPPMSTLSQELYKVFRFFYNLYISLQKHVQLFCFLTYGKLLLPCCFCHTLDLPSMPPKV